MEIIDLIFLPDDFLRKAVLLIDQETLNCAMTCMPNDIVEKVLSIAPAEIADELRKHRKLIGPSPLEKVHAAEERVVLVMKRLARDHGVEIELEG